MPYKKSYRRKRKLVTRRRYKKYSKINRFIPKSYKGPEHKYHDVAVSSATFNNTGVLQLLNGIAQGTKESERTGNRINIISIQFKGQVGYVGESVSWRICLVMDKAAQQTAPSLGIGGSTSIFDTAINTFALLDLSNRNKFVLLYSKIGRIDNSSNNKKDVNFYKKYSKPIPVTYEGASNGISAISNCSVYLCLIGNNTSGVNNPVFDGNFRITYTDA